MHFKPTAARLPRKAFAGFLAGLAGLLGAAALAPAQAGEELIYTFKGGTDGAAPSGGLVADAEGALYGTTLNGGGSQDCGTVFKLTPPASKSGPWTETVLYRFKGGFDGWGPQGTLIFDQQGALYGTASSGGTTGHGTVFKLTPPASKSGSWTETVLYSFKGKSDGANPAGALTFDAQGNLYGATKGDGASFGTIFKLTPSEKGQWAETVLYTFSSVADGPVPLSGLIFDRQGALYGATQGYLSAQGHYVGSGTVFKLTPPASGKGSWTETVLHTFTGQQSKTGEVPSAGLIFDKQGALYGTTASPYDCALGSRTVFKLTPPASGKSAWTETVLTDFKGTPAGCPFSRLLFDAQGALYGTTGYGGSKAGYDGGSVFKLTPAPSGKSSGWTLSFLHGFRSMPSAGGAHPRGLIIGKDGVFYGTLAEYGDTVDGQGAVFRLVP